MAKVIRCSDIGMDCDFEARADTVPDLLQKCAEHAKTDHGMQKIPAELVAKVTAAIRDE